MRGRAMIRPLIKAQIASVALGLLAPFGSGWPEWIAWRGGEWLSWGSIAGFGVVLAWNVLHPDTEARERRAEALEDHRQLILEHASAGATAGWARAVADAKQAGTFSLNGVRQPGTTAMRYAGPPALYTPSQGFEMMITVELRARPALSGPGFMEARRVSECEMCGRPLDVAMVSGSLPYLCGECRRRELVHTSLFR